MNSLQLAPLEYWLQGLDFGVLLILTLLLLFQVKHLVVDFVIQNRFPYMWMNKHKFFHPGGWLHAGGHAVASFGVLALIHPSGMYWVKAALVLCIGEMFIHFLIDLVKMRIGQWAEWKCNTSPYFWDLLGVDQFLHQITYIGMVFLWVMG
jgi:hypothetical protein